MSNYFDISNAEFIDDPDEERYIHDVNVKAIEDSQEASVKKQEEKYGNQPQVEAQPEQPKGKRTLDESGKPPEVNVPILTPIADFSKKITQGITKGVGDFVTDVTGLLPVTKPIDEWWDKTFTRSDSDLENAVRDAASVIIPSMAGGTAVVQGGNLLTKGMQLTKTQRLLGNAAARLGVDTAVTAVASTSERDDNVAGALNRWLGWNIPWGTREGDSPDVIRNKNVIEAAGMTAAGELIELAFALNKGATKVIPKDELATQSVNARAAAQNVSEDPLEAAVTSRKAMQDRAVKEEAIRRFNTNLDEGYDPFINDVYEAQYRGLNNVDVDPIKAKIDHAMIQRNVDTVDGRATSVVTDNVMYDLMNTARGSERADIIENIWLASAGSVDIKKVKDGRTFTAKEINAAVDNLSNALNPDVPLEQFKEIVQEMRRDAYNSHKVLDEQGWVVTSRAFKKAFDEMYNPNNIRASAMLVQNAADNVADTVRAAQLLGDTIDTTRQQELIMRKLEVMAGEMKVRSYIMGSGLEFLKFKRSGKRSAEDIAAWLASRADQFDEFMANKAAKAQEFVKTYTDIATKNPEFLKPFGEIYDFTNGNVDDLSKLHRYMEDRIGVIGKAFLDGNPEVPSAVVQGAMATRYNNVLSGLSAVRAAAGNATLLVAKPLSILSGAIASRDTATLKRAVASFGGVHENLQRAFKHMADEWKAVRQTPDVVRQRGRADLSFGQFDDFMAVEEYVQNKWANSANPGDLGRVAAWNLAKLFHGFNKNKLVTLGVDAMHAIDGFTNSMLASMGSRAKAYDELFGASKGVLDMDAFNAKQRELYNKVFKDGVITDEAVKFAGKELTLNLDSDMVSSLEDFMRRVPVAKSLFMFPRTGLNGLQMSFTYAPGLNMTVGRVRRLFKASTVEEMSAVLMEHGIKSTGPNAESAFKALKSEYVGRQLMGGAVVMAAGMAALSGNLTGSGPQDGAERKRMMDMGAKFNSIRNPITGEWHSYKGFDPFETLLSLVGDVVYQANRVDQAVTEDWFRKIAFSISQNVANKTFLSGFEPLVAMLSGDEGGWNRFIAMQADSMIPGTGFRSLLSQAVTPQLKDVENDIGSYLANRNKWMFNNNDQLKDLVDVYTGEPIRYHEPLTAAANALLPFFKTNGGMEPWRQWLLSTGWDQLNTIRTNKVTGRPLTASERSWINNWIGQNAGLADKIDRLRTADDGWWDKQIKEYVKARGLKNQSEFPIKELVVHEMLSKIHNEAFNMAWSALEQHNAQSANIPGLSKEVKARLNVGDISGARKASDSLEQILNYGHY